MKISAYFLSFCGFCILYICNADWIDELIENYLTSDYEDVAPFISSVTAGTEEFDQIVQELSRSRRKWWPLSPLYLTTLLFILFFTILTSHSFKSHKVLKKVVHFLTSPRKSDTNKEEIQTIVSEFLERKLEQLNGKKQGDDVPVKLLWKGGTLMESSVHCNIRGEPKVRQMHRQLLHSKLLFKPSETGGGEAAITPSPSLSDTSTTRKITEIRRLLESEEELNNFVNYGSKIDEDKVHDDYSGQKSVYSSIRKKQTELKNDCLCEPEEFNSFNQKYGLFSSHKRNFDNKALRGRKDEPVNPDWESSPDEKLMNRIRLLESRLRLEELKNKNWISRMSRAEGILQQLNKQVERIEETRPVGTLTETLKITSTVTNWPPSPHSGRDLQFTLDNQYPQLPLPQSSMSLTEIIRKKVGLPACENFGRNPFQLTATPHIPALPSPNVLPHSSFLSKFLCR